MSLRHPFTVPAFPLEIRSKQKDTNDMKIMEDIIITFTMKHAFTHGKQSPILISFVLHNETTMAKLIASSISIMH